MVEKSFEYHIEEEMDQVLPDLEQRMANHGYSVYTLGEEAEDQIWEGDEDDDIPYPPELMTNDYGFTTPQIYIAEDDATTEDILYDGEFVGAVEVLYTSVAVRDPSIEDEIIEWAEEWEDIMDLTEMDDPHVSDRTINRGQVTLLPGDRIDDPL